MAEPFRLYLDQMLRLDVAQALHREGHDAMRASDVGQSRADDMRYCRRQFLSIEFLSRLMNISVTG